MPLAMLTLLLACTARAPEPARPPDVLLLTVDTLRADHLSGLGYDRPTSPRLDALMATGTVFERATTPIPRTTPALASLLTGRYPQRHRVRRLLDRLPAKVPSLPEIARAQGYATVAVVSNHVLAPKRGLDRGFDVYDFAGDGRIAAATTADALRHVAAVEPERPLLLWVHYIDPHVPYAPPEQHARAFDPGWEGPYATRFGGEPGAVGSSAYPPELGKETAVFANPLSDEVTAHVRRLYAADVRQTDDAIGTLLDGLVAARGSEWRVVFTADHGESLGEHDYAWDHGDYLYQGTVRVPLALIDLQAPEARRLSDRASLVDVAPTVLAWMGWPAPDGLDGVDLRSTVPDRVLFAESGRSYYPHRVRRRVDFTVAGRFRSALAGDLELIHTPGADPAWELYDLAADPGETSDLWAERAGAAEVRALVEALSAQLAADPKAEPPGPPDADDLEALKRLGYLE